MRIVHIAAHLGGGVGKAHSALCRADGPDVERHYLLLEQPRDTRYADAVLDAGAAITIAPDVAAARRLVAKADILQIEWWNHPRLYECLCRFDLPESRTLIWSHISGLFAPYMPPQLLAAPQRFLFTSACSLKAPAVQALKPEVRARIGVINSGFGFGVTVEHAPPRTDAIGYLGTVDFSKLSPLFFDVIDHAQPDNPVSIWGSVDPDSEVLRYAAAMRQPDAVCFPGHAADPEAALRQAGIFLYLLQPQHFGTAENALIEAMSLGCVPLVFDNPAEREIVEHGRTGFVESSVESAAERLQWMLRNPAAIQDMGRQAARAMAETRSAEKTAADFADTYRSMLATARRKTDYVPILGFTPADWFLSTQDPLRVSASRTDAAKKGTLAHFLDCFPGDASLNTLMAGAPARN